MPENGAAYELWCAVSSQLRTDFGQVVGVDYNAVYQVAETLGIDITPAMLTKLRALEGVLREEVGKTHGKNN